MPVNTADLMAAYGEAMYRVHLLELRLTAVLQENDMLRKKAPTPTLPEDQKQDDPPPDG